MNEEFEMLEMEDLGEFEDLEDLEDLEFEDLGEYEDLEFEDLGEFEDLSAFELFPSYPPPRPLRTPTGTIPVGPLRVLPICRIAYLDLADLATLLGSLNRALQQRPRNLTRIRRIQTSVRLSVNRLINRLGRGLYARNGCTKRDLRGLATRVRRLRWSRLRGMQALRSRLLNSIQRAMRRTPGP